MKHILSYLSYFLILIILFVIATPFYIKMPKFEKGYRAYVYCKNNVCNKGYILNVKQKSLMQEVSANFLDKKDKTIYNKLIDELKYDKNNKMYIITSEPDCINKNVKTKDIETQIKFKNLPFEIPTEKSQASNKFCKNLRKDKSKLSEKNENLLCDLNIVVSNENVTSAEYYFRYLLYKLA